MTHPDEVLKQARQICARVYVEQGLPGMAGRFRHGNYDDTAEVQAALAALTTFRQERDALVELLRRYHTVVKIIVDAVDLDPEECVVRVNKMPAGETLASQSLADVFRSVDTALKAAGGAE